MDFGTNSVRLLIVRVEANQSLSVLQKLKETVRLGEGEFAQGRLQPDAIERAVDVAVRFAQTARSAGSDEIIAVATAATREAENAAVLLDRVREEAQVDLRVVSGQEEARLIYLGVASGMEIGDRTTFFIDIGGGSTETIVGNQNEHFYLHSHKLGAIRLSNLFLAESDGPISPEAYETVRAYVRRSAASTLRELSEYPLELAVGSSGTIESLTDVVARMKTTASAPGCISYEDLQAAVRMLCSLPLEKRRLVPGLTAARADIIIGGAAILDVFMEELGIASIRSSDRGLRDGLLVDYLQRHQHTDLFSALAPREHSVLQLGRSCHFNEEHARVTARLALSLFDSARDCGLHTMGDWERELLEYAALLHHIGSFLTYSGYQRHSHYLISNAEMLGFDRLETTVIATTVLYHRGSLPRRGSTELRTLELRHQDVVRYLSTLIRIAENLDRSQAHNVTNAYFAPATKGAVTLVVDAAHDPQVELSGVENQRLTFERTFEVDLRVEVLTRPRDLTTRSA